MTNQELKDMVYSAIGAWKNSSGDFGIDINPLELQNDPVVRLLLGAMAHQASLVGDEAADFLDDLLVRFIDCTTPAMAYRAAPAIAMMQVAKWLKSGQQNNAETWLDGSYSFSLKNGKTSKQESLPFLPLLKMRVVNASLASVEQIRSNQWHIEINENEAIDSMAGMSFFFNIPAGCNNIKLYSGNREIPLIDLYDFERLPFVNVLTDGYSTASFSTQHQILQNITDSICNMDCAYVIVDSSCRPEDILHSNGCIQLDLVIDIPLDESIRLGTNDILLNCVPVANIAVGSISLTREQPIGKIPLGNSWFMSIVEHNNSVEVRQVATERKNVNSWTKRLSGLLNQYENNYFVYREQIDAKSDAALRQAMSILREFTVSSLDSKPIYLMLNDMTLPSLDVAYMLTQGAVANGLGHEMQIEANSAEIDSSKCSMVIPPSGGRDEVKDEADIMDIKKYQFSSSNRIVSRSDIVSFCRFALKHHFQVDANNIHSINLASATENTAEGFMERIILVEITTHQIMDNSVRISRALSRMIQSRTASMTPIKVVIR